MTGSETCRQENLPARTRTPPPQRFARSAAFDALHKLPDSALRELGLRRWGQKNEHPDGSESGPMLWLFPGEWYSSIPQGLPIVDINFRKEKFVPGRTDNDIRFGCLSFGILRPAPKAPPRPPRTT